MLILQYSCTVSTDTATATTTNTHELPECSPVAASNELLLLLWLEVKQLLLLLDTCLLLFLFEQLPWSSLLVHSRLRVPCRHSLHLASAAASCSKHLLLLLLLTVALWQLKVTRLERLLALLLVASVVSVVVVRVVVLHQLLLLLLLSALLLGQLDHLRIDVCAPRRVVVVCTTVRQLSLLSAVAAHR
jgi:hypothetical protein